MRLKPSGLRYLDIAKFQCGLRFYSVRCLYTGISVRFCGVRTPLRPPLFRLLSYLKFYYMHVKVSCKSTDTEADLSVLIHANLISSTKNDTSMLKQTGLWKLFELRWTAESGVESDNKKIDWRRSVQDYDFNCCITQLKWQNTMQTIYSVSSTSEISLATWDCCIHELRHPRRPRGR